MDLASSTKRNLLQKHRSPSVEVARTTNIGMIEQRRLGAALVCGSTIQIVAEDGGDAPIVHRADVERAGRDRLGARRLDAAIEPQDAETGVNRLPTWTQAKPL